MKINLKLILIITLLIATSFVNALKSQSCDVQAKIFPSNDTVVTVLTNLLTFHNRSINATSHKFIVDRWNTYTTDSVRFYFEPGLHTIMLVAYNGNCTDTSTVLVFNPGQQPANRDEFQSAYGLPDFAQYSSGIISLTDGSFLFSGYTRYNYPKKERSMLIKIKPSGCIDWSKQFDNGFFESKVNIMSPLKNGGFVIAGEYFYYSTYFAKFDHAGNAQFIKKYTEANTNLNIYGVTEASNGDFILLARNIDFAAQPLVIRLDSNGNVKWARVFDKDYLHNTNIVTVFEKNNEIYFGGMVVTKIGDTYYNDGVVIKVSGNDGSLIWAKKYSDINMVQNITEVDGNLVLNAFILQNPDKRRLTGLIYIDQNGTVLRAYNIFTVTQASGISKIIPNPLGGFYIFKSGSHPLSLQPYIAWESIFVKVKSDLSVEWSKVNAGIGKAVFKDATVNSNDEFASIGDKIDLGISPFEFGEKLYFTKIKSAPTVDCIYGSDQIDFFPVTINDQPFLISDKGSRSIAWENADLYFKESFVQNRYTCPNVFFDSCSVIKLDGKKSLCSLSDTVTYRLFKNSACTQPVEWGIPQDVTIVSKTDTELKVRFNSYNNYLIYAKLPFSCVPVIDSVIVAVQPKVAIRLDLGKDTVLCEGNSIKLSADNRFLSFLWHDGSKDSTYTVTTPGKYWITVFDSCFNTITDTINVTSAPPVPLSIGPDRSKCNMDTLLLSAPAGFLNYSWGPGYNMSSQTSRQITVNPLVDTIYYLKAEKIPGCFGFDTVKVKVNTSPAIRLGNDTSFCSGQSITLSAGAGFVSYQWSNGNTNAQTTVNSKAVYTVTATTTQGCKSYDTLQVLNVYANPVVRLNKDTGLCVGSSKLLDAGNFASYIWNNGSIAQSITVTGIGNYNVTVTDVNGCRGTDSSNITVLYPVPAKFLLLDTSICSYGSIVLNVNGNFQSYLWNTNSTSPSIEIKKPGQYWLRVTDENRCSGKDTINVIQKECMVGLYVPTAFTPDGNGLNDEFKPMLFGDVEQFKFAVFNRWGQVIFQSVDRLNGWDGTLKGLPQVPGLYTWTCSYKLANQPVVIKTGTVTLIR